jgi:hypothetical protein
MRYVLMDSQLMLIGLMSLKNPTVFVQFHPVACRFLEFVIVLDKLITDFSTDMAKLNIEMSVRISADRQHLIEDLR